MTPPAVFGLSVLMSFVAFGIVTRLYIWPRLQAISREGIIARNWSSRKAIPWYSLKRMAVHESPARLSSTTGKSAASTAIGRSIALPAGAPKSSAHG